MLTEEQIKNLKYGDKLSAEVIFISRCLDGDIYTVAKRVSEHKEQIVKVCLHPDVLSIPIDSQSSSIDSQSKYDPYRKFKKGDKVKCRTVFGRTCNVLGSLGIYTVIEDEKEISGNVIVVDSTNITYKVKAVFLELVTPVEELEPYYIEETEYEYCVTIMVGDRKDSPATYHKRMHPDAKAAAEAECKRLNTEWLKEHENKYFQNGN